MQVTDSEQPPVKVTQLLSININSSGNTAVLQGSYPFQLNGFTVTGDVISPTKFVVLPTSTNTVVEVYESSVPDSNAPPAQ